MKNDRPYLLTFALLISSLLFTLLGFYWNQNYYHEKDTFTPSKPTLAIAMQGLHDGLYTNITNDVLQVMAASAGAEPSSPQEVSPAKSYYKAIQDSRNQEFAVLSKQILSRKQTAHTKAQKVETPHEETFDFTTATDDYFSDAVFIGDSRTVGISEFSGIENATFLCKTSLSIYDFDKPKITYNNEKTSIKDVLTTHKFGKVYLMVGINECGVGTPESFYERYKEVVMTIRRLQPDALIFIQGNLLVTKEKSDGEKSITNENISARNELIATLANQKDIFYIDINESSLCKDGSLVSSYTWDQVHIKAQYYSVWKDFLLKHAIVKG